MFFKSWRMRKLVWLLVKQSFQYIVTDIFSFFLIGEVSLVINHMRDYEDNNFKVTADSLG